MATRQYVGARYVPKFYDYNGSSAWRSGTEYEALTIVTVNGNSYTSKIPVPSSVGSPDQNPDYWVATGLYNEQVEAYRQLTLALADRVTDVEGDISTEETARSEADTTLGNQITAEASARASADSSLGDLITAEASARENADNDIEDIIYTVNKPLNMKNCVFIGDSYATRTENWVSPLVSLLGLTNSEYIISAAGSTGFAYTHEGQNFRTLLTSAYNSASAEFRADVTHVIVCGGANDMLSALSDISTAIREFCDMAHQYFTHCTVYIGFIGCTTDTTKIKAMADTCYAYKDIGDKRYVYLNNVEYTLHRRNYIISDGVHPDQYGATRLGYNIWCALLTGSCSVKYEIDRKTLTDASSRIFRERIENGLYLAYTNNYLQYENLNIPIETHGAFDLDADLGTGLAVGSNYQDCAVPVTAIVYDTGGVSHTLTGSYIIYNNKLQFRYVNTVNNNYTIRRIDIPQVTITYPTILC